MDDKQIKKSDVVIRYGNSTSMTPMTKLLINTPEAINKASNKKLMMEILSQTEGVAVPTIVFSPETNVDVLKNEEGFFFMRDRTNTVKYVNQLEYGFKYATKEIKNKREYRVHVMGDTIMGVYRKKPNNIGDKILKAENCHFHRCGDATDSLFSEKGRTMAIKAVQALGLDFAGVDIIYDKDTKKYYVLEVNSSPSLNTENIKRFTDLVLAKYNGMVGNANGTV